MMTEIERIIKEGILPKAFFHPETICDFYVNEKRKKIWAVELDILLEFDKFCKKHDLKYFLMFGSLLGAVRHNGFIPWDDDTDVCMPRSDYNRFLNLKDEFKYPFFVQTPYTDKDYLFTYTKIRNSQTTAIITNFIGQRMNWGMMLDVFPLDYIELEGSRDRYNRVAELATDISNYMRVSNPNPSESDKVRIAKYTGRNPLETYEEIHKIANQFNYKKTSYVSVASLTLYSYERSIFYAEDFEDSILHDFHGFKLPIPIGYDRVLNTIYPNYMTLPPVDQRGAWHNNLIFDPETPFKEYFIKYNYDRV